MAAMIKFRNVTKTFGSIQAIKDVSFDVEKGDFLFITGPSGAGKTTLLRLILREIIPDAGKIIFEEENIVNLPLKEIPDLRQKIGVVFQDFKVLPERTVRENVEVALAVVKKPQEEWDKRVEEVLKLTGLKERADLFPSQLSGGELQRVSLARALVVNPKVILADEPTGNLDWDTADKLMELLEKINEEGKTIIMATHHKLIVDRSKKPRIELEDGKVVSGGVDKSKRKKKEKPTKTQSDRKVRVKVEEIGIEEKEVKEKKKARNIKDIIRTRLKRKKKT